MGNKSALLLIDCQEDYFARQGLQPERETLVAAIAEGLAAARAKGWPVLHIRTLVSPNAADAMPHRRGAPEAVAGTAGAEPPSELRERDGEPVLSKRFFSAFDAAGLEHELRGRGVQRLVLAGVHTHACIQASALDAYARGFEVAISAGLVGSYDPAHGARALAWLDGRAATVGSSAAILGIAQKPWLHRDPCDWDEVLDEVEIAGADAVARAAKQLAGLPQLPLAERIAALGAWHAELSAERATWVEALIRNLGKPRRDAEGEVAYGLDLLAQVAATVEDEEEGSRRRVRYRPHGVAGLVTPWNNPFAIPLAKLAPTLAFGNAALWKPALAGSRIAGLLHRSLERCGLAERVALVTGDAATGEAVLGHSNLVSFTGSVAVGRLVVAEAARRGIPVQAELGGSNAAIVDASADLDAAAEDLAAAMFSFSGQRCTAIRRIVVVDAIAEPFVARLVEAVRALKIGDPGDAGTQIGPVIAKDRQRAFIELAQTGGTILAGGGMPEGAPEAGCWVEPTLIADVPPGHPLLTGEVFGPLAAIIRVPDLAAAVAAHNATGMGLLGALFTSDESARARFLAEAEAGLLSINRARPPFAAAGPFLGWKESGYGPPEHGRWNRDFYTRAQAVYDG